jgi:hypothetical protein
VQKLTLILILAVSAGCANTKPAGIGASGKNSYYEGGDGTSFEQAVLFPKAGSSMEGIPLEGKWIAEKYPGARKKSQAVVNHGGRLYDRITIVTAAGEEKEIYFDMTSWFGMPGLR